MVRQMKEKLNYASDYQRGAHPAVMQRLNETNMIMTAGYGRDKITEAAKDKIRMACDCPDALVEFLVGGTQTNATVIDAFLKSYQGVLAAETGHISVHEAGAIEQGGHKVITLPHKDGKICAGTIENYLSGFYADPSHTHMVEPGMVYLSQPTEYGTLYKRSEIEAIRKVCDNYSLALYIDGARLAYALACPENDMSLADLASLCDAFYIGGTKCGALFGEAVVIPDGGRVPGFFTIIKQHGALLAKGRLLGVQFDALFTDELYFKICRNAINEADRIRTALSQKGYPLRYSSPTNQVFCEIENAKISSLSERVNFEFWEKIDENRSVIRLVTDWASSPSETDALISAL